MKILQTAIATGGSPDNGQNQIAVNAIAQLGGNWSTVMDNIKDWVQSVSSMKYS